MYRTLYRYRYVFLDLHVHVGIPRSLTNILIYYNVDLHQLTTCTIVTLQ